MSRPWLSLARLLAATGLVVAAFLLARLGRSLLDELIAHYPEWSSHIERVGGWAVGMVGVLYVGIPFFRLYGSCLGDVRSATLCDESLYAAQPCFAADLRQLRWLVRSN